MDRLKKWNKIFGLSAFLLSGILFSSAAWTQDQEDSMEMEAAEEDGSSMRSGVYLEEIIVTAEKREASVQDTAAAINAFDDAALQREGIETISDIQFAVPNMTFSAYNFGAPHLSIRGISRGVVATSGDDSTSIHVNGAYAQNSPILLLEFFDLERVEILRGPQGTLYGRNSTGGVVNFITRKPDLDMPGGSFSVETGSDGLQRTIAVANLPITERFGIRIGGYSSQRDGYVKNTYTGNDIDSRDLSAGRVSLRWRNDKVDANLVLDYFEESDSRMRTSKQACKTDLRPAPFSIGCEAGHELETYEAVSAAAGLANIWANQYGLYGPAASQGVLQGTWNGFVSCARAGDNPRAGQTSSADKGTLNPTAPCSYVPNSNLREVHATTDPTWFTRHRSATLNIDIDVLDGVTLSFTGHNAYQSNLSTTDYNWNTGAAPFIEPVNLGSYTQNADNIDAINAGLGAIAAAFQVPCQMIAGITRPRCAADNFSTRNNADLAAYYNGTSTNSSGATVGDANDAQKKAVDAAVADNSLGDNHGAATGRAGFLGILNAAIRNLGDDGTLFPAGNPGPDPRVAGRNFPIGNDVNSGNGELNSFEVRLVSDFGEDQPYDFLVGLFAMEANTDGDYQVHGNSLAHLATLSYAAYEDPPGDADNNTPANAGGRTFSAKPPQLGCQAVFNPFAAPCSSRNLIQQDGFAVADLSYYNNQTIYEVNTWAIFGEFYRDLQEDTRATIGIRYTQEEKRIVAATQSLVAVTSRQVNRIQDWDEVTGRISLEHRFGLDSMFFATLSRSYKSGGLNPPSATGAFAEIFDPEYIDSAELGIKSTAADGRIQANLTYFFYNYAGYQTSKIVDRTSVNENIDVQNQGVEFELLAYPVPSLRLGLNFAWLDTEVVDSQSVNNADPTNGMSGWTTVKGLQAANWIAPTKDLNGDGAVNGEDAVYACANAGNFIRLACAKAPANVTNPAQSNVPKVMNRNGEDTDGYKEGVTYAQGFHPAGTLLPFGFETDLTGNQMAEAPEGSVRLEMQYTAALEGDANFVLRTDYYWQTEFYGRVFNSKQNLIPEWDVFGASMGFEGKQGNWDISLRVDNITDDDHITGLYFTDASSGNFTNVFLLNPRTFSAEWNWKF
ncbi:MAG: TonB-dependent receptor [Gammaproteobacteria bacterium AqS3]|nr:TonB-dependent receptor [Gammaproteobacteria bacterium AqS3]